VAVFGTSSVDCPCSTASVSVVVNIIANTRQTPPTPRISKFPLRHLPRSLFCCLFKVMNITTPQSHSNTALSDIASEIW
jgi:hypothetical protein